MLPRYPDSAPARAITLDEHDLEAALRQGYIAQRQGAGHREKSIACSLAMIDAFRRYAGGPPWDWSPEVFDSFSARLLELGNAALTIRTKQQAVKCYLAYACDEAYVWNERCARLGVRMRQIVKRSNSRPHHRNADRGKRRSLTPQELSTFFQHAYAEMTGPKNREIDRLAAQIKYAAMAMTLGFAARAREMVGADYPGHVPAADGPTRDFSTVAGLEIWHGKAVGGGEERSRFVPAIALFWSQLKILDWYLTEVRPKLVRPHSPPALLLDTTGKRFGSSTLSMYFRSMADAAGISPDLTFHCLRHTFATTLYRHGFEVDVIRALLGHELQSTTMGYIHAETPLMQQRLLAHNARLQTERTTRPVQEDEKS
jgi:integrase/recombinase XerC